MFLKKIRIPLIVGIVEIISYIKFNPAPESLKDFFFIWMIIGIALLLLNIFNMDSNSTSALSVLMSGSSSGSSYGRVAGSTAEHMYKKDKDNVRKNGGLFDPKNLSYILFAIINLIVFWFI